MTTDGEKMRSYGMHRIYRPSNEGYPIQAQREPTVRLPRKVHVARRRRVREHALSVQSLASSSLSLEF